MSDELKPCPFCWHEPKSYRYDYSSVPFPDIEYTVECRNSKCPVNPRVCRGTDYEATEAWNTRAEKTCRYLPDVMWSYEDENGEVIDTEFMSPFDDGGAASCSACGGAMKTGDCGWFDEEEQPNGGIKLIPKFEYCPYCGAKVVENE